MKLWFESFLSSLHWKSTISKYQLNSSGDKKKLVKEESREFLFCWDFEMANNSLFLNDNQWQWRMEGWSID